MFVRLSSDIALVIDAEGRIENVAQSDAEPIVTATDWVGRAWVDTVTRDTRAKIEKMLHEVTTTGIARRREINHLASAGAPIPMAYTALRLGDGGQVLAVGRDLRTVAAIQQRFLDAQRDTEQSYWKARELALQYELLFQVATDALMLVDSETLTVIEANRAATNLFEIDSKELVGSSPVQGFDRRARTFLEDLLTSAAKSGKQFEVRARLSGKLIQTFVAVTSFRVHGSLRLLMRVRVDDDARIGHLSARPRRDDEEGNAHDRLGGPTTAAIVVTDSNGTIVTASKGFLKLVLAPSEEQVKSQHLTSWLESGSFANLVERVKDEGLVQDVAHIIQAGGPIVPVAVSAAVVADDTQQRLGFTFYPAGASTADASPDARTNALDVILRQLGTSTLPELLKRAGALFEQQLIAKALERTGGDVEAAAQLLDISASDLARRRSGRD